MQNGLILGRSPNLVVSLITAAVNLLVLLGALALTAAQIAGVDGFVLILIAVIANTPSVQIAAGNAAAHRASKP